MCGDVLPRAGYAARDTYLERTSGDCTFFPFPSSLASTRVLTSFVFLTAIIPIPRPTKRIRRRFSLNGGIVRPVRSADCELNHARVLVTHDGSGDR